MNASALSKEDMGIIIQYGYCTGCRACEMACKQEHGFSGDELGIKVMGYGLKQMRDGGWDYFYIPAFTNSCDACASRIKEGKLPACVHHCTAKVMECGKVDELSKKMTEIQRCVLYAPGVKTKDVD